MKKLVYYAPALLLALFYGFILTYSNFNFAAFHPIVAVIVILPFIAGFLMSKGIWHGAFLGVIVGAIFVYMGFQEVGQLFKEWYLGIALCLFYAGCGYLSYKKYL